MFFAKVQHCPKHRSPTPASMGLRSPILSTHALAEWASRLRHYLVELEHEFVVNLDAHLYAKHSRRRGGVIAAWEAGVFEDLLRSDGEVMRRGWMEMGREDVMSALGRCWVGFWQR